MEAQMIETIIVNLPNFVFAGIAVFALMRRLGKKDELINRLIDKWEKCEEANDTREIIASKPVQ